jgi:hypothetical protein
MVCSYSSLLRFDVETLHQCFIAQITARPVSWSEMACLTCGAREERDSRVGEKDGKQGNPVSGEVSLLTENPIPPLSPEYINSGLQYEGFELQSPGDIVPYSQNLLQTSVEVLVD